MNIAQRIQKLRKQSGLSQEQLAEKLGVSRQAVSKWESEQSVPDIDKLAQLSELFGVSTDHLIKGEEVNHTESAQKAVEIVHVSQKLYILDANKRKLAAFEEFGISMIGFGNTGKAELVPSKETVQVPVCALYGSSKGIFGTSKKVILGYYGSLEDAQRELHSLSEASRHSTSYSLKYAVTLNGVRIAESGR